jgi:hypothetical protein
MAERLRMGRRAKTLVERVLENSFRPGRYGHLLAGELLPAPCPFEEPSRRELWRALRQIQQRCHRERGHEAAYAGDFSQLVRALHGSRPPRWYRKRGVRSYAQLDRVLASIR